MSDKEIRHVYRSCPCFSYDVEGVQTWLEDMAAQGLVLEADGTFLGIFTFQKTHPQRIHYRLAPVKAQRGIFADSDGDPDPEEQEFSKHCGWQYLVRYGAFCIYRATGPNARPLHTDPAVHAMALGAVKRQQHSTLAFLIVQLIVHGILSRSLFSFFRTGAVMGLGTLASIVALCIWLLGSTIGSVVRLQRYQKRLRRGESLDLRKEWKPKAVAVCCIKLLPAALLLLLLVSLGISLTAASRETPIAEYPGNPPFAVIEDVFPQGQAKHTVNFGDYNTFVRTSTALSENWDWNENADVSVGAEQYHCILRITHHETVSALWAKGLFRDYYLYERLRYRGKRFEELEAPETGFDQVRVFRSYGILHVLLRQDNTVTHAVVTVSQKWQENRWQLWLDAMEAGFLEP